MENKFPQRGAIYLACSERHQHWDSQITQNGFPACAAPKLPRYPSERIHPTFTCGQIVIRKCELWRWAELFLIKNEKWQNSIVKSDIHRLRCMSVQATGRAPVIRAFQDYLI